MKLFKLLKQNRMLNEKILKVFRYAEDDLPSLEKRCQQLSSDVLELQSRKKRLGDEVASQCSSITQLEKSLNWYKMEIKQKKEIISNLDQQLNHKSDALEKLSASRQTTRIPVYSGTWDVFLYYIFRVSIYSMQKIGEKIVYNTNEEILDPSHTALVLWDVLRAFEKIIFNKEEFSKNLNSIVELARKSNIPIFFTSVQTLSKRFESSANIYTMGKLGFDRLFEQFAPEDMDFAIKPKQEEIVINKHTASIFIDTGFERMLRNAGIITVVFTGIATECGIESSARDAFNRGFYSVVVSDCVSSPDKNGHDRSLENMKNLITIINSNELENIWSRAKKLSSTSTIQDDSNNIHHEHIGDASKSDVSPNTPTGR